MMNLNQYWILCFLIYQNFKELLCFECTFDKDFCNWSHDEYSNFNWTRQHGRTKSEYTGPDSDHTTGNGHYIYIETNNAQHEDKARIISPVQEQGPTCLIFWYSMYGQNIGSLNVYMRKSMSNNITLFSRSNGMNTKTWIKAVVSIIASEEYRIVLEGEAGNGVKGDIAVDDISLTVGMCSANCTFETELCNWKQDRNDDFDWSIQSGKTDTPSTGPFADHTTGDSQNGYYVYIETSYPRVYGDKARLISPMQEPGSYCLTFWYNMYGLHIYTLNVYIKTEACGEILIFSKVNDTQNIFWTNATISFDFPFEYQLVFEGIRGNGVHGDIAIDDVLLTARISSSEPIIHVTKQPPCLVQRPAGHSETTTLKPTTMTILSQSRKTQISLSSLPTKIATETKKRITTSLMTKTVSQGNLYTATVKHGSTVERGTEAEQSSTITNIVVTNPWNSKSSSTIESFTLKEQSNTTSDILNTTQVWNTILGFKSTTKSTSETEHYSTTPDTLSSSNEWDTTSAKMTVTRTEYSDTTTDFMKTSDKGKTHFDMTTKPVTKTQHVYSTPYISNTSQTSNTNSSSTDKSVNEKNPSETTTHILNTTQQLWTANSDISRRSLRAVYISVITIVIISVLMVMVCVLIWRRRKQSKLKLNIYSGRGLSYNRAVSSVIMENTWYESSTEQQSPNSIQPRPNQYTEVILCHDEVDNNNSRPDQNVCLSSEDKHIYNHLGVQTTRFIDTTYSHVPGGLGTKKTVLSSDSSTAYSLVKKNSIQNQTFSPIQYQECENTYNKLETTQINSDKEVLNLEDMEVDNESAYDMVVTGRKSKQLNKTDNYSHVKIKRISGIRTDPSSLYARVTKNVEERKYKPVKENENTNIGNAFEPNVFVNTCSRDGENREFALEDDCDNVEDCNHDYFVLEKVDSDMA